MTDLLTQLVQAETVNPPGNETRAALVLEKFLKTRGISSIIQEVQPNRSNLIASVGGGHPRILLTSHLDVVEVGEMSRWKHGPFSAHIEDGVFLGRGACDAKGQVAAMTGAFLVLAESPPCEIVLAAVMGEEKGGLGSKRFVAGDSRFDAAIVGEPTQLNIANGHKGRIGIFIDFIADTSHPTRASDSANPVFHLAHVMDFLRAFGQQVQNNQQGSFVVLHVIAGNENVLTPPERCSLTLSWWFAAQMSHDDAINSFKSSFDTFAQARNIDYEIRFHRGAGSCHLSSDHYLVRIAQRAVTDVTGSAPEVAEFPASCDMYVFQQARIPTIILGPGDLGLAHAPNESICLDDVLTASRIYTRIIMDLTSHMTQSLE